jgi:hypothetical protein
MEITSCEKHLVGGSRVRKVLRDNSKYPRDDDRNSKSTWQNSDDTQDTIQDNTDRVSNDGDDTLRCDDSEPGIGNFSVLLLSR